MAEGGGNQRPIFHFPITVNLDSKFLHSTVVEGDRYRQQTTNIIDSNIGEVVAAAAQPVPGAEQSGPENAQHDPDQPDNQGGDDVNVAEEMQQMNLATNRSTPGKKPAPGVSGTKSKTSYFESVANKSQKTMKEKTKHGDAKRTQTTSSSTQTLPVTIAPQGSHGEAATDEAARLKIEFLKERSTACYEKAVKLLEQVTKLQRESDFYTMLQLAECYLLLGKNEEANETIEMIRCLIMTSQTLCANDVKMLAKNLAANSAHTRAMILFPIACDMFHARASSPDDAVNRMFECIDLTYLSVEALVNDSGKPRQIVASGIRYQEQMYESLSSVKNAEPGNKVLNQARAVYYIGNNYGWVGEHEKMLKLLLSGVELLQQHFKGKESMYLVYGRLLNNIGAAHVRLGNFTEAEKYYVKSVHAYTEATDYPSESEKQKDIEITKNNLKIVREILVKK